MVCKLYTVCGSTFTAETGTITSPSYPNAYEIDRACNYLIEAPIGKGIFLDFTDFDIEQHALPDCEFDYVAVILEIQYVK